MRERTHPARPPASPPTRTRPPAPLLYAVTAVGVSSNTLGSAALPDVLHAFRVGAAAAGILVAAPTVPSILLAPAIGFLADRWGRRALLWPALVLFGLAGGLAALAGSFWLLVAARIVQGAGAAGTLGLVVVLIADHWEGAERTRIVGRNAVAFTVSLAAFPALGGLLTDRFGWRAAFAPYWGSVAVGLLAAWLLPAGARRAVRVADQAREALAFLRTGRVAAVIGTGIVVYMGLFGLFYTVLPLHVAHRFGLGADARGLLLGLPALASTPAAFALAPLSRRLGQRRLVLVALALFATAYATMGLAPTLWLLTAGALAYGFAEGLTVPTLQDLAAGSAPASSRGMVAAVYISGIRTGQTLGPLATGVAAAALSPAPVFLAGSLALLATAAVLVATGQPGPPPATRP